MGPLLYVGASRTLVNGTVPQTGSDMAKTEDEVFQDRVYFKCECTLNDHLVEFQIIDLDAGMDRRHPSSIQLCVSPILNFEYSFFKRLWIALRYIVKKEPRYSRHFDSVTVTAGEDLDKLEKMIRRVSAVSRLRKLTMDRKSNKES